MKRDKWVLIGVAAVVLTAFVVGASWYSQKESARQASLVQNERLIRPHSPTLGPTDAPVTLVEFLDPECEACGAFYPTVKAVLAEFDGKVRFVVRYMPYHKHSAYAVSALEAARNQGKYWEALETLFSHRDPASHDPAIEAKRPQVILESLERLGLDMEQLKISMTDFEHQSKLKQDQEDGQQLGVQGTPTLFINGKALPKLGHEPLREAIRAAIGG